MNINFEKVITKDQIKVLADTANIIWHEAFINIITLEQIEYMIEKFQSFNALSEAINKNNYNYYLIKSDNVVIGYTGLHEESEKLFLSRKFCKRKKVEIRLVNGKQK